MVQKIAGTAPEQGTLFEDRFLEDYAGQIMREPVVVLVEPVANAWDAYATKVDITWPDEKMPFRIEDNGHRHGGVRGRCQVAHLRL